MRGQFGAGQFGAGQFGAGQLGATDNLVLILTFQFLDVAAKEHGDISIYLYFFI